MLVTLDIVLVIGAAFLSLIPLCLECFIGELGLSCPCRSLMIGLRYRKSMCSPSLGWGSRLLNARAGLEPRAMVVHVSAAAVASRPADFLA